MVLGRKPFQFLPLPKSGLHTSTYRIHLTRIWGGKGGVACDKIVTPVSGLAQPASRKPCHNDNGRAKGIPMRQKPIIPHLFFLFISPLVVHPHHLRPRPRAFQRNMPIWKPPLIFESRVHNRPPHPPAKPYPRRSLPRRTS
jgi:hypothetical protein